MGRRILVWGAVLLAVCAIGAAWRTPADAITADVVLFSARRAGMPIVVPAEPSEAELRAATLIRATLAKSARLPEMRFPISREDDGWGAPERALFVGATMRAMKLVPDVDRVLKAPFDTGVALHVERDGAVVLDSERREWIEHAASWFLEKYVGAHWFMPGPLGESVPPRRELTLARGTVRARPGYLSRDLLFDGGEVEREWYARNRLAAQFDHTHNLSTIFRPDDFRRTPEMAPMRNGARFIPRPTSANWQPNLLSPEAVRHAADFVNRAFAADPRRLSFSLSINDTDLYDDSAATMIALNPVRYFRHRPNYSNLVFGFTNAVAEIVGKNHPDRWLPAYAYYWCENTPDFPIARNVVPFLTADRSQWSHPDFAAEDRALIGRWCRSGAEIVGVYDYFYGAPYFCPRPTLYAVKDFIPFAHRAGVRAFFGETNSNWALDGPKAWLAAQLLWDPSQDSDALLATYYREFWGEAEEPMREFFAICERVWLDQPWPALWLRFYRDEDQAWIFPPASRTALRAQLDRAAAAARTDAVRARVALARTGFDVSEAHWAFAAARESFSRLAQTPAEPAALVAAWQKYLAAREQFSRRHAEVRRDQPLAIAPQDIAIYLRNQPDSRAARQLVTTEAGRNALDRDPTLTAQLGLSARDINDVFVGGKEILPDREWRDLRLKLIGGPVSGDWTQGSSPWRGSGEAWEGRRVELKRDVTGTATLRIASARTDEIGQWLPVTPGAVYAAQVKVRAKTSPGTTTHLIVSFLDANGRFIGQGRTDRLPPSEGVQETELCVLAQAPPNARHVGFGLRVLNQIDGDFAEFSEPSLRVLVK